MLDKFANIARVARTARGRAALRSWRPFSLASYALTSQLARERVQFRTVIDGGANVGQFARAAASTFPEAKVHSIEPLPEVARQLRNNLRDLPRVTIHETCIGSSDGTTRFHRNDYSQASSVLPMAEGHGEQFAGLREAEVLELPMKRLDTLFPSESIEGPALLKLDLQGYELEALRGATRLLTQCSHVLVETVFEELYRGEPLFTDLLLHLRDAGFQLVRPVAFLKDASDTIVQTDVLFRRRGIDGGKDVGS